jgi:hypothetical protein
VVPLSNSARERIQTALHRLATRALRVLAVAYVPFEQEPVALDAPIDVRVHERRLCFTKGGLAPGEMRGVHKQRRVLPNATA